MSAHELTSHVSSLAALALRDVGALGNSLQTGRSSLVRSTSIVALVQTVPYYPDGDGAVTVVVV